MTQTFDAQPPYGQSPSGPPPYGPYVPIPPTEPRRRRGPARKVIALVAATALVAGATGGAVGTVLADDSTSAGTLRSSSGSVAVTSTTTGSGSVAGAAATIIPSTVVIDVTGSTGGRPGSTTGGSGSGVVLDTEGLILTNAHVITAGGAISDPAITVTFADGQTADASVVGVDESSDLAVIRVTGVEDLTPATFADSDQLAIGQAVVAVGAPLGLSGTVTEGIVSAVERPVRTGSSQDASTVLDAVQTDAAINPGNSGGPLVDLAGAVVGINSAIATVSGAAGQSGNIGVGFAIPSNDARDIADQLVADGSATHASLGVSASETEDGSGALVQTVEPGSAAAEAGLQPGDVVTAVAERRVLDLDTLLAAIRDHQPGDSVALVIRRDGAEESITVTLGSRTA